MSDKTNNQISDNSKSTKYIIIFTFTLIVVALIIFLAFCSKKDNDNPSATGSSSVRSTAQDVPDATEGSAGATKGNIDATIQTDIIFREVDFSLSIDEIINKEKKMKDTLDKPSIAESSDGYTYITFASNPKKPLSYNNISASAEGNPGLTYVMNNGNLDEVRLQFGSLDSATYEALLGSIRAQYGESTFYRSTDGTENYWWKTSDKWLMLTKDSVGSTLFYRKN